MRSSPTRALFLAALSGLGCASGRAGETDDRSVVQEEPDAARPVTSTEPTRRSEPDGAADAGVAAATPCTEGIARLLDTTSNHCYLLFDTPLSWSAAQAACAALSPPAYLVSTTSQQEEMLLDGLVAGRRVWIGASDQAQERTFTWTSGESFIFSNWNQDEPNDDGTEDCVAKESGHGRWNDDECKDAHAYVCERAP
jgi:hypothetical protein